MKSQSINGPLAIQMLNSLATELNTLEMATGRIRMQVDTLLTMLAVEPASEDDTTDAGLHGLTSGHVVEALIAENALAKAADEAGRVEEPASVGSVEAAEDAESAESSHSDAAVIGLCAQIEASVAEFAAAAEVADATMEVEHATEPVAEAVTSVDDGLEEHEPAIVVDASSANADAAAEVDPDNQAPTVIDAPALAQGDACLSVSDASNEVSEPVAVTALPAAANNNATDDAPLTDKVVELKVKRHVWPQRLAACASVLLIAAAAVVVVAMPDVIVFGI